MRRRSSGAVLLLCVLLLAALSLLGFAAGSDALLQERMGANQAASEAQLRLASDRLRNLEMQLLALPGLSRPSGCPESCLPGIPEGIQIEEVYLQPADATGRPQTSWFRIRVSEGAPPELVASILARPWGDAAWSDGGAFCSVLPQDVACGRFGWEHRAP